MDSVMYDRQATLDLKIPKAASIIGCGGVGAWVGIDLALTGVQTLCLFDDDELDYTNLNRLPFSPEDVGKQKVDILGDFILKRRPDIAIRKYGKLSEITKPLVCGNVVDCTDKLDVQKMVYNICTERNLMYYRVGYDGNHITVIDGKHTDAPKPKNVWSDGSGRDGYTTVSSWAAPPQMIASMITYVMCHPKRAHAPLSCDIGELFNESKR